MNKTLLSLILSIVMLSIVLFLLIFAMHEEYVHQLKRIKTTDFTKEFDKKIESFKEVIETQPRQIIYQYFTPNGFYEDRTSSKTKPKIYELTKYRPKKKRTWVMAIKYTLSILLVIILLGLIGTGLYFKISKITPVINGTTYVTVLTGSMSEKHEDNDYLESMNLNNQIEQFALIGLTKVDDPKDIKLFDVYAYKDAHGDLIIHRIVKQEVIDNVTYYTFRGDANEISDYNLIEASEVLYKYNGYKNVPLGYIFSFINSILGQIAIIYSLIALLTLDIYDSKKEKEYRKHLNDYINFLNEEEIKKYHKQF